MKTISRTFYISAFKLNNTPEENLKRTRELKQDIEKLTGVYPVDGIGSYKFNVELTCLIAGDNNTEAGVMDLANKYNQECILVVYGNDQAAELVYTNGDRKVIGKMVCVGEELPKNNTDYTYVNGKYYIVEG